MFSIGEHYNYSIIFGTEQVKYSYHHFGTNGIMDEVIYHSKKLPLLRGKAVYFLVCLSPLSLLSFYLLVVPASLAGYSKTQYPALLSKYTSRAHNLESNLRG